MKITSIDVIALEKDPGCLSRPVLCRVNTDQGLYGIGEAGVAIGSGSPAAFAHIKDIAPMILGMDPWYHEVIWEKLFRQSFWAQGNGAIVMAAISAIDIAIWDLKGKIAGVPLYKLLGGKQREKLRCYASQLQFGWKVDKFIPFKGVSGESAYYAESARKAVEDGYDAIKTNFMRFDEKGDILPYTASTGYISKKMLRLVEDRIRATRDAVGPDVDIIMENHAMTDASTAIQIGKIAQGYDIMFYEEGTPALNPGVMKKIAEAVDIPLATGERTYTRWGFLPFLENHCLQVIQPDIGNCGGITEAKKICDLAHIYDVSVQTHVCSSPISVAIALHLEAAIPNFIIHEHHICNTLPSTIAECKYDYQPEQGYYAIPELPGHGQEISEGALKTAHIETVK
ncbi:mandelate racemase/muconate lactonizing enzyme family protein [Treponema primitia]|uniref:mandelate racemase/muconate lactonizing enzyme family protein n=1 Tax=Treponema primitia TaxID=88058 RepID=UPI00025551B5|nr:mandelate racemase/muconate lactonizing enzyme family protein [Treponema primitia]